MTLHVYPALICVSYFLLQLITESYFTPSFVSRAGQGLRNPAQLNLREFDASRSLLTEPHLLRRDVWRG